LRTYKHFEKPTRNSYDLHRSVAPFYGRSIHIIGRHRGTLQKHLEELKR